MEESKWSKEAIRLLEGETTSDDDTINFLVLRARTLRDEGNSFIAEHDKLKAKIKDLQRLISETIGAMHQYQKDIELLLAKKEESDD